MRPKKKILLIDQNEERLSIRRFLLTNRGFQVLSAATPEEAQATHKACDLVVGAWPCAHSLVTLAKWYHVPSLVLVDKLQRTDALNLNATQVLSGENCAPWCIVEAVKAMSAAQHGPKPVTYAKVEQRVTGGIRVVA